MKEVGKILFGYVAAEFNSWIAGAPLPHGIGVPLRLRMISAADDQLNVRHFLGKQLESFNHQLKPLIGSPFAEGKDAIRWISAS